MKIRCALGASVGFVLLACAAPALAWGGKILSERPCPVDEPMGMTAQGDALWISDMATRTIVEVKADGTIGAKLSAHGNAPTGLTFDQGMLLLADRDHDFFERWKPGSGQYERPIAYYERWAAGLANDGRSLFVVDARDAKVHRVDSKDGTTIASWPAPASNPTGIAYDGRQLWVADHVTDELYRVDPRDGMVTAVVRAPGPYASGLAVAGGSLWVADYQLRKLFQVSLPDDTPYVEDQERRVRASYELTYRVTGPGRVTKLVSYLAVPGALPGQHVIAEPKFDPAPTRFVQDKWGQRLAVFELGTVEAGQVRRVRWEGDFSVQRIRFQMGPEKTGGAIPAELTKWLADDVKYDLGSRSITELVERVTAGKRSAYDKARAIYEHLAKSITYDRSGGWNNAAAVLERGTGSCSEYTFALVAMLRKAGIPARYVGAISERGDEASFDDVFHRWAEAWLPGYGWVPMDANAAHGKGPGERAAYFGGRSNRHVVTTIGGGGSEYLEWGYNHHEDYAAEGGATLEIQPIGRFRPLSEGPEPSPARATRVIAPDLEEPAEAKTSRWERATQGRIGDPWLVALVILVAVAIGFGLGKAGASAGATGKG